ncbi:MAG: type I DNA topoisomerase [Gammaproteobacteria bacterium]|nr:type I DNA topoisomerase [Gammaproteobacteria bacterium]
MPKNLIVVESPAKARTITKYLSRDFKALASYGHVRDLLPKSGAVDTDNGFDMHYELIDKNKKHVDTIARAVARSDALYLATDPDREGEAISWHLHEILKERNVLDGKPVHRVAFFEFTKRAIQDAIEHPRELSTNLINAQQARRALDYLVGFNLSPLLWKKVRRGLSAGRVQSPALRLIAEREQEIERFESREYWTIEADAKSEKGAFSSKLAKYKDEKLEQFSIANAEQAHRIEQDLVQRAGKRLRVVMVEKKKRRRNPSAPFITSTLQQEASRKLGFSAQRTMRTAQQLYEGVEINGDQVGLITYMRTDSVNLAQEAVSEIRALIVERYGEDNLPKSAQTYKSKSKNAQEAHEAIRPTAASRIPSEIQSTLTADQFKLYDLVWKRTVACQMVHATLDTVAVDLEAGSGNTFRANGSIVVHPGFMSVYQEDSDDRKSDAEQQTMLPPLEEGDDVDLVAIRTEQHFTEPPPRYTEASLVKTLEAYGIGRPSTYASIISTLQQREYVVLEKKRFIPTDVGQVVNKFLSQHFSQYVDYDFTARLEDELDAVSRGEQEWQPLLSEFWERFKKEIEVKERDVARKDVTQEELDESCPTCGSKLSIRLGRHGKFIGCTAYPECKYTRNLAQSADDQVEPEVVADRHCPKCDSQLVIKHGRYGKFIGCGGYPECRYMEPLEKPEDMGVSCPECKQGSMLKRRSRNGKIFYSCERYPKCKYAVWNEPVDDKCPSCGHPMLTKKITKRRGTELVCPQKECKYAVQLDEPMEISS